MKKIRLVILLILVCMVTLISCMTTIAQIQEDPQVYADKTVRLTGKVDSSFMIPFSDVYIMTFSDSTGTAVVFTEKKHKKGESLTLTGSVITFPEDEFKGESKKSAARLKEFLVKNDIVDKEIAQGVADVIIKTFAGIGGGLGKIFFIQEK
jgi:predicted small secreted protein